MAMKRIFANYSVVPRLAVPTDHFIAALVLLLFLFSAHSNAQQTLPTMSSQQPSGSGGSSSGAGSKVASVLANVANGKNSSASSSAPTLPPGGITSVGALTDAP